MRSGVQKMLTMGRSRGSRPFMGKPSVLAGLLMSATALYLLIMLGGVEAQTSGFEGQFSILGSDADTGVRLYAVAGIWTSNVVEIVDGRYEGLSLPADLPPGTKITFFVGGPLTSPEEPRLDESIGISGQCEPISSRPGTHGVPFFEFVSTPIGGTTILDLSYGAPETDFDSDGLADVDELSVSEGGFTEPGLADTDGDGLSDGEEIVNKKSNPLIVDTDCDGSLDATDLWINTPNSSVYTVISLVGAGAILLVIAVTHWRWGLTGGRKRRLTENRRQRREFQGFVEQTGLLASDKYDGYVRLEELMDDLGVDRAVAIKCLQRINAEPRGEYYVVRRR